MVRRPDLGYRDEGLSLTASSTYEAALQEFGTATRLPDFAYRSLQFLYLEDESLWTRSWIPVGTMHEIPEEGDLLPFSLGYHGVHVQNMGAASLTARFNLAQHGGCRVVPTQCQGGKRTACHFTSCGYSRDRGPILAKSEDAANGASYQYLGLRPERLYPVKTGRIGTLIFLNVDPDGQEMQRDPGLVLPEALLSQTATRAHRQWQEYNANWKFAAEALAACDQITTTTDGWLAGRRRALNGDRLSVLWLFPNLVILSCGAESCVTVLQHTAIGQVMMRSELLTTAELGPDRIAFWQSELRAAGLSAEAMQSHIPATPAPDQLGGQVSGKHRLQTSEAGLWGQKALIAKLIAMPVVTTDIPIFKKVEHYLT